MGQITESEKSHEQRTEDYEIKSRDSPFWKAHMKSILDNQSWVVGDGKNIDILYIVVKSWIVSWIAQGIESNRKSYDIFYFY